MAEENSRDDGDAQLARIAKANGVSVADLRRQLGWAEGESRPIARPAPVASASTDETTNPWRSAIITLGVLSLLAGIILVITGAALYGSYDRDAGQDDTGLVQLIVGSAFTTMGFVSFIAWMVGEMVLWRASTTGGSSNTV